MALHAIMAFWCVAGMAYALGGAKGVDRDWLDGSPFGSYVVPGLVLGIVVGGAHLLATIALRRRLPHDDLLSAAVAGVLLTWILVETVVIGVVSPLQPAVLVYGIVLFVLSLRLEPPRR